MAEPKKLTTGVAVISDFATSLIIQAIQNYKLTLRKNDMGSSINRFERLREEVDNCYAREAIAWLNGHIDDDSILSFNDCCEILGVAPQTLVQDILIMPNDMENMLVSAKKLLRKEWA